MTRRLVVAMVGIVVATLLVAGATTLALARWQAGRTTESDLRKQAEALVTAAVAANERAGGPLAEAATRRTLRALRTALRVDGVEFVVIDDAGRIAGTLPEGVSATDLDLDALSREETVGGSNGSLVFAAASAARPRATVVAVVTRMASPGLATAARWFAFAAAATVVLGVAVAAALARRLARPVRDASAMTRLIAAGRLSGRLPEPAATDHDELAELARSVNTMATNLERSKLLEQQFLLSVSHDLRTPLTSIRGYAEAIVDGATDEPRDAAGVILTEAGRLERLVVDLLDLARLDGSSFSLHPVDHDLRLPVTEALQAFTPSAERLGLSIHLDAGDTPVMVSADPGRIAQILANLLENAGKYARGQIIVRVASAAGHASLIVDDDGPGIAPDDLPHVFERLYVARHRPVRAEVGSGLGLAIVRQLAESMGGSVTAGVAPSGGAKIEVAVPLATPDRSAGQPGAGR